LGRLYASPMRVYLLLGGLALFGIFSGLQLPVSLFPNSSKPSIYINIPYGGSTPEEFLNIHGKTLEGQLREIKTDNVEVESLRASYDADGATYHVNFKWGVSPTAAYRETLFVLNSFASRLPIESRDTLDISLDGENAGFLAVSFYSESRDLDNLYEIIEPLLIPRISKVKDVKIPSLWNPEEKEISIVLNPDSMAALRLFPKDIEDAVLGSMSSKSGGSVSIGTKHYEIEMPRLALTVDDFSKIVIPTPSGASIHLADIAQTGLAPMSNNTRSFKTNGASSIILFASPRAGGNVKTMSEEIIKIIDEIQPTLPKDIKHKILVDPSEFIRAAIYNVLREVFVAALLAVLVLFVFIGSFKNVATAAIEIPLSMVLAFILMRLFGINLNLISLGGLALSAGMNVDGSVVVMENIFRHFEMNPGVHDAKRRLEILIDAVKEVRFPIIASTISSLVVFFPLMMTSGLSHAILGDLAKAVVFSHGFSALVALVLVPTVRLQLMASKTEKTHHHSLIEPQLRKFEQFYSKKLGQFINHTWLKWATYFGLISFLAFLIFIVLPKLPKEIVGIPDTDWIILNIDTHGNTLLRQMELQTQEVERTLLNDYGPKIAYTFSQVKDPNLSSLMARLKDKNDMRDLWKSMENHFKNTPTTKYYVSPWNPSELPIPDPPDVRIEVRGLENQKRARVAHDINQLLEENKVFPRLFTSPNADRAHEIRIVPHPEQWTELTKAKPNITTNDLADLGRVATNGRRIGLFPIKNRLTDIFLHYPPDSAATFEDVTALPVGIASKIVPMKALADVSIADAPYTIYREDERELFLVLGRENVENKAKVPANIEKAKELVAQWQRENHENDVDNHTTISFEDPAKDLTNAVQELTVAVIFSIILIFLTLVVQFGTVIEPLLVLTSIPLGFIGVISSLFIFRSSLSLNSILGVILLNGISVANSIILVDFVKRLVTEGKAPREAALQAAKKRLRPILITSLTTVLGMVPIASGLGEGGRILQPLGIAVSGGLWISMILTLFLVPSLQVSYLEWTASEKRQRFSFSWLRIPKFTRALEES
jgi:hydrophobic/amphiphilic exporter-1 (mainly G- bacteria), HAE1 family